MGFLMRLPFIVFSTACLTLIPACSRTDTEKRSTTNDANAHPAIATSTSPDEAQTPAASNELLVTAVVQNLGETEKLIASQAGKVVVVELWALW